MVVVEFRDGPGGQFRHVVADLVGGRRLAVGPADIEGLQKWSWFEGDRKRERLVTLDVAASALKTTHASARPAARADSDGTNEDPAVATVPVETFPPAGGTGMSAIATWSWYPKADDELLFPKGAEVREIEDVNGDWFFGVYMGSSGLFPSPYVHVLDGATSTHVQHDKA